MTAVAFFRRPPKLRAVGNVSNSNGAASPSFTSYRKGDLIVGVAAANSSTTPPALPAGWSQIDSIGGNSCAAITATRVAASDGADGDLGTWTGANGKTYLAFRNWDRQLPVGGHFLNNHASAANITHAAITQSRQKRNRIISGAMTRANTQGLRTDVTEVYLSTSGLRQHNGLSTEDPVVSTWASQVVTNDTGNHSGANSWGIEICGKRRI